MLGVVQTLSAMKTEEKESVCASERDSSVEESFECEVTDGQDLAASKVAENWKVLRELNEFL